jgi:hypothetical protein
MKRQRDSPIHYEIKDGYVILNYDGKQYAWTPPMRMILDVFLNEETYDYSIIHNNDGQAMFNVENLRNNKDIFRQEVNPLKDKDVVEWVKDK